MYISVVLMFRDCETYLPYLFAQIKDMELYYEHKIVFTYYIYENDSSDNTFTMLKAFSELPGYSDRMFLHSETLNTAYVKDGTSLQRIERITFARNRLLDIYRESLSTTDWTLFIDSNIYFEPCHIEDMLNAISNKNNASIITCNTIYVCKNNHDEESRRANVPDYMPFYSSLHYYDTYAYVDTEGNFLYPMCASPECNYCTCCNDLKWKITDSVHPVKSCWGGFVLIDSAAFKHKHIKWETCTVGEALQSKMFIVEDDTPTNIKKIEQNAICEHIAFCAYISDALSKPCVVVTTVSPYWMR